METYPPFFVIGGIEAIIPFVAIGGVIALIVGGIIWAHVYEKKRRALLQSTAEEMGLTFFPDGGPNLQGQLSHFKLFNTGRGRKLKNLVQGDTGEVKIAIFDYQYTTGSGKNSHTHRMSIAALQSSELNCPDFTMRPEGFMDRIGGALGFQDIDFDDHPEFSNAFVLKSSNEDAVRDYFKKPLLDFFAGKQGICVEAAPGAMFFYRAGKRVKPTEIKDLLSQTYEVFGHMVDSNV